MAYHKIISTSPDTFYPLDAEPYVDRSKNRGPDLSLTNYVHDLRSFNYGNLAICPPAFNIPTPNDGRGAWSFGLSAKVLSGPVDIFQFNTSTGTTLSYDAGILTLSVMHEDATETILRHPESFNKVHNIYCVVDTKSIMIYIDGDLAASKEILSDSPTVSGDSAQIGSATGRLAVGGIVFWSRALSASTIRAIHQSYNRYPYRREIAERGGYAMFTPELMSTNRTSSPFTVGEIVDAVETGPGNFLAGADNLNLSLPGYVMSSYYVEEDSSGVEVTWGDEYLTTALYSLDGGDTWFPLNKGRIIDGTEAPVDGAPLVVRLEFAGGEVIRPFISDVKFIDYINRELYPRTFSNRPAQVLGDTYIPETAHHPQLHGDGMRLFTDAIVELNPDVNEEIETTSAIEVFYVPAQEDLTGTKYIMNSVPEHSSSISVVSGKLNFTGFSSVYVNGSQVSSNVLTLREGLTYHIAANYTTAHNQKVTFGSENSSVMGPISSFTVHLNPISQIQVTELFNSYMSYLLSRVGSSGTAVVSDAEVSFYTKDWTTRGS